MITLSKSAKLALTEQLGRQLNRGTFRLLTGDHDMLVDVRLNVAPPRGLELSLSTVTGTIMVSGAPHTFQCLSPAGQVVLVGGVEDLQVDRPFLEAGDEFALTGASLTLF